MKTKRKERVRELTYVNNMSLIVDHNVSIVSVLDLQQISDHRVGGHRFDEIVASIEKIGRIFGSVRLEEVIVQRNVRFSAQLIP